MKETADRSRIAPNMKPDANPITLSAQHFDHHRDFEVVLACFKDLLSPDELVEELGIDELGIDQVPRKSRVWLLSQMVLCG